MPKAFEDMVSAIKKSGKSESEAYAIATSQWKKSHNGKPPTRESKELQSGEETLLNPEVHNEDDPDYINNDAGYDADEEEEIRGIKEADVKTVRALRKAMISELDAANVYEKAADSVESNNISNLFSDVADEEETHVGEFNRALKKVDPTIKQNQDAGEKEANSFIESKAKGDVWEWKDRSTTEKAIAWAIVREDEVYQFTFSLIKKNNARWNSEWKALRDFGAKAVLLLDVRKVSSEVVKSFNPIPDVIDTVADPDVSNLVDIAKDLVKDYLSKFSAKSLFNYLIISGGKKDLARIRFIVELIDSLNGFTRGEEEQDLEEKILQGSRLYKQLTFLLKNSSGPKIEERVGDTSAGTNSSTILDSNRGLTGRGKEVAKPFRRSEPSMEIHRTDVTVIQRAHPWLSAYLNKPSSSIIESKDVSYAALVREFVNDGLSLRKSIENTSLIYSVPEKRIVEDCTLVGLLEDDGATMSDSFMDTVAADSKHDWKKDWEGSKGGFKMSIPDGMEESPTSDRNEDFYYHNNEEIDNESLLKEWSPLKKTHK